MNTPLDPSPTELALQLEERGFDSLWTGEHSHIPISRKTPWPAAADGQIPEAYKMISDPYVSLMAAGAVTKKLKLCTGIALLNQRDIFSQAKTISTLDRLSDGRVIIGTSVGWNQEEFENIVRHPWKKRYTLLRETVAAMRNLWRDEESEYHGELIDFDPVWSGAKPCSPSGPPVVLGVAGPLGMQHTLEWADGWFPVDLILGDDPEAKVREFRQQLAALGRDPDKVSITVQCMSTPDLDQLKIYRDSGVERIVVGVAMDLWGKHERILPLLEEFAEYIPQLK